MWLKKTFSSVHSLSRPIGKKIRPIAVHPYKINQIWDKIFDTPSIPARLM